VVLRSDRRKFMKEGKRGEKGWGKQEARQQGGGGERRKRDENRNEIDLEQES
jgi:hypothetical protein